MRQDRTEPTIGLTLRSHAAVCERRRRAAARYRRALEAAGARVLDLEPGDEGPRDVLEGLLLTGGGDVEPQGYGAAPAAKLRDVDAGRDAFELTLVSDALERAVPVLGICRGAQVLGVALGGSLIQDIATECGNAVAHERSASDEDAWHMVLVEPGTLLAELVGPGELCVNSAHHQANDGRTLGPGVRCAARGPDGIVEAIECTGAGFVLGVQWHPERMYEAGGQGLCAASRRLFEQFVASCGRWRRPSGAR